MSDEDALTDRIEILERKLFFVMQTLSLTRRTPDGQTDSRSLTALYEEMIAHAGTSTQTLADVAQRSFGDAEDGSGSPVPPSVSASTDRDTGEPPRIITPTGHPV